MIACAATHVVGSLIMRDNVQISSSILKQDCKQVTHATKMQTQRIRTQRRPMQATRTLQRGNAIRTWVFVHASAVSR